MNILTVRDGNKDASLFISLLTLVTVSALVIVALMHLQPPTSAPESSPKNTFSAKRAMVSLQEIAKQPHPIGSAENSRVKNYLTEQLTSLGLAPQVQKALAVSQSKHSNSAGFVENVLVRISGKKSSGTLMVVAHYDSTAGGAGAADNGASVAAMLETIRALDYIPRLQNDVIFLFTDGEEYGLLGAEAFVADHPWANDIDLVLNFEYRGNQGPHLMFETGNNNGKMIAGFAEATPNPIGNSLMHAIYKRLPNDTDFSALKRSSMTGMNFSTVDGYLSYHSQLDSVELIDEASLQHQGETMLALASYFGNADLHNMQSSDRIYFDIPVLGFISYPKTYATPLFFCAIVLFFLLAFLAAPRARPTLTKLISAGSIFIIVAAVIAGVCQAAWSVITYFHLNYYHLLIVNIYSNHWYLFAFSALAVACFFFAMRCFRGIFTHFQLISGVMACWLIMAGVSCYSLQGGSYLFLWPLICLMLAYIAILASKKLRSSTYLRQVILVIGVAPGLLLFIPLIKLLYLTLTPQMVWVPMLLLTFLAGLCLSIARYDQNRSILPRTLLLTAAIFFGIGSVPSALNPVTPISNNIVYAYDSAAGNYYWISLDRRLDKFTKLFITDYSYRPLPEIFGRRSPSLWLSQAGPSSISAPLISAKVTKLASGERSVKLHVVSKRGANKIRISVDGAKVMAAEIEGKYVSITDGSHWSLNIYAPPEGGVNCQLTVQSEGPFMIIATDQTSGVPEKLTIERPNNMIPLKKTGDFTLAVSRAVFN